MKSKLLKILWVVSLTGAFGMTGGPILAQESGQTTRFSGSLSTTVSFVTVDGDEEKFREDWWVDDQWTGGLEEFILRRSLGENISLYLEGKAVFPDQEYNLLMKITKPDLGFIHAGYEEYPKYFDGTGGFFEPFTVTHFELDDDLRLDIGRLFVHAGLDRPHWPKIVLGYEHRFKEGEKSLTGWGSVSEGDVTRKIFPTFKEMDEKRDIFRVEIDHDIGKVHLGDDFRYEHYETDTVRFEQARNLDEDASKSVTVFEEYSHNSFFNTFRADSHVTDKVYLSLGYLFNSVDGASAFRMFTVPFESNFDKNWFTRAVDVDLDSHVVNTNMLLGPWKDFAFYGGFQGETTDKDGDTDAVLAEIFPGSGSVSPEADIAGRTDKGAFEETVGVRYKGIPYTTLYAEGRWTQQDIDLFEREMEDSELAFERFTDTDVGRQRYTVGFNTSPVSRTTLSVRYRRNHRSNEYDHTVDTEEAGYPAFILDQDLETDELNAKISYRPTSRIRTSFNYRLVSTQIDTLSETDPPSSVESGDYDANIYNVGLTVTPVSRFYLTGLFSYQDVRARSFDNGVGSVVTYDGDVYSLTGSAAYAMDNKTDVALEYIYSRSDNFKDNSDSGLPLLLDNERHGLLTTFSRRIREDMELQLRYGFYNYEEKGNGGIDDYSAHLFGLGWKLGF